MNTFVTFTSRHFVFKAVCLVQSFLRLSKESRFVLFSLDDEASEVLRALESSRVTLLDWRNYETAELLEAKTARPIGDYYYSCKAFVLQQAISSIPESRWVYWLDSDMMFFSNPDHLAPPEDASCFVTPHFFTQAFEHYEKTVGRMNAGLVGFRNTASGRQILAWWGRQCLVWCGSVPRPDDKLYGDQFYIERFAIEFAGVAENTSLGINAAPWNAIERQVSKANGCVFIGDDPLVIYHFQGLQLLRHSLCNFYAGPIPLPRALTSFVYQPYSQALSEAVAWVGRNNPGFDCGFARLTPVSGMSILMRKLLGKANIHFLPR